MGRTPRDFAPGAIYHVFSRGSNRQAIFTYDSDRADFLMCLDRVVRFHELRCLAYCLMLIHYHLVVETFDGHLSSGMKALNRRYSLRFNRRYGRDAHLFKNRFGVVLQETQVQLMRTLRYTLRNPVDSSLCASPDDWPWSSYRASIGVEPAPSFLSVRALLSHFGDEPSEAMARFRAFVTS